jgi:Zn-dependent peptidase ImmA (M78 family)
MTIKVKFLPEQPIERDALGLLEAYFHDLGQPIQVPIPADEILETHLGLSLDFDDLQTVLCVPDVLGALWADRREVFIDQSLEPTEHPEMEGRYYFSVGHEIGHWRLHRQYFTNAGSQVAMFTDSDPQPTAICRTSQRKRPIEWQADHFSSCFLMPRQYVLDAWAGRFGSLKPFVYADVADQDWTRRTKYCSSRSIREIMRGVVEQTFEPHAHAFETIAKKFNSMFRVSIQAMRFRLEKLGLLRVDHPAEQDLFAGH